MIPQFFKQFFIFPTIKIINFLLFVPSFSSLCPRTGTKSTGHCVHCSTCLSLVAVTVFVPISSPLSIPVHPLSLVLICSHKFV